MAFKKKFIVSVMGLFLLGCATTAEINQQAEGQYEQALKEARSKGVLDNNSATAQRVQKVFRTMLPYADRENQTGTKFNWQIAVVRSNELNAWAMPGGKMMFYTGLVEKLQLNDDEIAVVMGHEMAHALKEHGKSTRNVGIATSIIGVVADIGLTVALGSNSRGVASDALNLVAMKPYSRSNETEADEVGLFLMAKSGYNPQYAPKLWQKMQAQGGSKVASIFSTHPSDEARQENLQRLMPEAMKYYQK